METENLTPSRKAALMTAERLDELAGKVLVRGAPGEYATLREAAALIRALTDGATPKRG